MYRFSNTELPQIGKLYFYEVNVGLANQIVRILIEVLYVNPHKETVEVKFVASDNTCFWIKFSDLLERSCIR